MEIKTKLYEKGLRKLGGFNCKKKKKNQLNRDIAIMISYDHMIL